MRDHLSWQTMHFWLKDLHFNTSMTEPVPRNHLAWQTNGVTHWGLLWPMGWSFKQVLLYMYFYMNISPSRLIQALHMLHECSIYPWAWCAWSGAWRAVLHSTLIRVQTIGSRVWNWVYSIQIWGTFILHPIAWHRGLGTWSGHLVRRS